MTVLKHIHAIILLPVMVTLILPSLFICMTNSAQIGCSLAPQANLITVIVGILFVGLGIVLTITTISLFITVGQGTLAPWQPTRKLVVRGAYCYVRNPMISGIFFILLGEALALGSVPLVYWFLVVVLANMIYIRLLEEPGLKRRFGKEYILYMQNVPRWIPRLKPWKAPEDEQ